MDLFENLDANEINFWEDQTIPLRNRKEGPIGCRNASHHHCKRLHQRRKIFGEDAPMFGAVGALFISKYDSPSKRILLGQQPRDNFLKHGIVGGKIEPEDEGCFLAALQRELQEETHQDFEMEELNQPLFYDSCFETVFFVYEISQERAELLSKTVEMFYQDSEIWKKKNPEAYEEEEREWKVNKKKRIHRAELLKIGHFDLKNVLEDMTGKTMKDVKDLFRSTEMKYLELESGQPELLWRVALEFIVKTQRKFHHFLNS